MATTTDTSHQSSGAAEVNGKSERPASKLSDSIKSKSFWRESAPKGIVAKDTHGLWSKHLAKRKSPAPLSTLCNATSTPLLWGIAAGELSSRAGEFISLVDQFCVKNSAHKSRASDQAVEQLLSDWLEGTHFLPQSLDYAFECLAIAHLLPRISENISPEFWWTLADALSHIAISASNWRSDAELPPEQGLAQQISSGELPLTLAYFFPEIRSLSKLRNSAQGALSEGVAELLNGNGLVQAEYLGFQRPLLACWTRCHVLGEKLKKGCWNRKTEEQYQWMVTHALGLSTAQGTPVLGSPDSEKWTAEFLAIVLEAGGDAADATVAKAIFSKKLTSKINVKSDGSVPESSSNCEWSGLAYMRTDWERTAPLLAVDYSSPDLRLECWSGTQRLMAGAWTWETTLDDVRLEPAGSWDETCWFSDDDVDYLELSMDLSNGAQLERQILLTRDEMFLLLSDYIMNTTGGKLAHKYRLPLDASIDFESEKETREGVLVASKTVARVLPLALPEWRVDPRVGQLTATNGRLQLEHEREGKHLACPVLIDLNKSRAKKPCTWRQLTIAQSLEVQPHDVAVGYRAQCGKDQWLIYRSLEAPANRTVLGQNLSSECLVARFLAPEGEVDELLEIE